MSAQDRDVVLLISGKRRAVISKMAAEKRRAEGLGRFDDHAKIHRIEYKKNSQVIGDVLDEYAIPDETGRCRFCNEGKCKTVRVSVMRSAESHGTVEAWTRMRVNGNRRGRKQNFTAPIERELDPRQNARELRELSTEPPLTGVFYEKFGSPNKLARELELERNIALAIGGLDAVAKLDAERRKVFIETLNRIYAEPPRHMWGPSGVAEYIAKIRQIVFPYRDAEVEELRRFVDPDIARALNIFLDEIEDHAAEIAAARHSAAAERDRRMNDPKRRAEFEKQLRELNH